MARATKRLRLVGAKQKWTRRQIHNGDYARAQGWPIVQEPTDHLSPAERGRALLREENQIRSLDLLDVCRAVDAALTPGITTEEVYLERLPDPELHLGRWSILCDLAWHLKRLVASTLDCPVAAIGPEYSQRIGACLTMVFFATELAFRDDAVYPHHLSAAEQRYLHALAEHGSQKVAAAQLRISHYTMNEALRKAAARYGMTVSQLLCKADKSCFLTPPSAVEETDGAVDDERTPNNRG